ncbi:MAG: spermidine synthase [Burkholderiaceae bacterium]
MFDPDITLSESDGVRYLHFGSEWIQGAMRVARPWSIEIDYQRHMMAWQLFLDGDADILQIGLGAGALTKFVHRYLPGARTTVVEASAQVASVARSHFRLPADDDRLETIIADGGAWVATPGNRRRFDVIQVDAYDAEARGPVLESEAFYRACARALRAAGLLVVNLFGEEPSFERNLDRIFEVFGARVLLLPPVDAGNVVVLAFKGPALDLAWSDLYARAAVIEAHQPLRAAGWVNALKSRYGADAGNAEGRLRI